MKKLIPAMCLLLVSAVLMGTSTFAWFTMNTTVTASGMKVNAVVPKSLVISTEEGGTYSAAVNLGLETVQSLYPVSTVDTTAWYAPSNLLDNNIDPTTGAAGMSNDENGTLFQELTTWDGTGLLKESTNTNVYAVKKTVYVKSSDAKQEVYGLYVSSLTVNNTEINASSLNDVSKALRIAVVTTGKTLFFAPTGYDSECKPIASINEGEKGGSVGSPLTIVAPGSENGVLVTNDTAIAGDSSMAISIFVWYEGQDKNANNTNALKVQDLDIIIEFTSSLKQNAWE